MLGGEDSLTFEKRKRNDFLWKTEEKKGRIVCIENMVVKWICKVTCFPQELWKIFDHLEIVDVSSAENNAVNVF